jgi:type II secretory ATPase GspE/PulE/Tfp pilus assembly ATPase PilB-like protein
MTGPHLQIIEGKARRDLPIGKEPITVGRHGDNVLVLVDNQSSRFHCVIERTAKGLLLRDLKSRNGTFVNSRPVEAQLLKAGDVVVIGSTRIRVMLPKSAGAEALDEVEEVDELEEIEEVDLEEITDDDVQVEVEEVPPTDPLERLQKVATSLPDAKMGEADITLLNARNQVVHPGRVAPRRKPGQAPEIVDILRTLLWVCFRSKTSDIHIEPKNDDFQVRTRVDGTMVEVLRLDKTLGVKLTAVVKILCELDIAARNVVQEGHFAVKLPDRRVDYRVSFAPAMFGQKLVIRVLDTAGAPQYLWDLDMPQPIFQTVQAAIQKEAGSILVVGPTGSGKTTTLYAVVRSMDSGERNIVTIEDPVEIQIEGVTQIPVTEENTFAALLKSVLRQDPDAILVGEIRDQETARTAMQAAMTGHLVFSTLHSRDTVGALFRLIDLGVEPYLVASGLQVILAQRLVRKLCPACKKGIRPTSIQLEKMRSDVEVSKIYEPAGCPRCLGTGFTGRICVFELLNINETIRDVVMRNPNLPDIQRALAEGNFASLQQSGYNLVAEGITSFSEVDKAVGV